VGGASAALGGRLVHRFGRAVGLAERHGNGGKKANEDIVNGRKGMGNGDGRGREVAQM